MSIQAVAWAIDQQEVHDPVTQLVLICLANYAAADGSSAYPGVARLALDTRLSERAVQYQLRKLEKMVLIRKGNQAIVAARISRADKRPTCYEILMKERGAPDAPRVVTGCTATQSGVHPVVERGAPHAPNPKRSVREPSRGVLQTGLKTENEKRTDFERLFKTLAQQKKV